MKRSLLIAVLVLIAVAGVVLLSGPPNPGGFCTVVMKDERGVLYFTARGAGYQAWCNQTSQAEGSDNPIVYYVPDAKLYCTVNSNELSLEIRATHPMSGNAECIWAKLSPALFMDPDY